MTLVDNIDEAAMGSFVGLEFTRSAPFLILSVDRLMDVHGKFQGQVSLKVMCDMMRNVCACSSIFVM